MSLNVVIQSKDILERERIKIRERQGMESFNLNSQIESFNESLGKNKEGLQSSKIEGDAENNMMRTSMHGVINRFSK